MARKKGCTHSRHPVSKQCRSKVAHERALRRATFKQTFLKGKLSAALKKRISKKRSKAAARKRASSAHAARYSKGRLTTTRL